MYGFIRRHDYDEPAAAQAANVAANHSTRAHRPEHDDLHDRIHCGAIALIHRYSTDPTYRRVVADAILILEHDAINAAGGRRQRYTTDLAEARCQNKHIPERDGGIEGGGTSHE